MSTGGKEGKKMQQLPYHLNSAMNTEQQEVKQLAVPGQ